MSKKTVNEMVERAKRRKQIKRVLLSPTKLDWYQLTIIVLLVLILNKA